MIRLLILSDAHRDYLSLAAAIRLHPEADAVFFLGDGEDDFYTNTVSKELIHKKVTAVCGNCDMYSTLPKEELVLLGGKRIFALHAAGQIRLTDVRRSRKRKTGGFGAVRAHAYSEGGLYRRRVLPVPGQYSAGRLRACRHYGQRRNCLLDSEFISVRCFALC